MRRIGWSLLMALAMSSSVWALPMAVGVTVQLKSDGTPVPISPMVASDTLADVKTLVGAELGVAAGDVTLWVLGEGGFLELLDDTLTVDDGSLDAYRDGDLMLYASVPAPAASEPDPTPTPTPLPPPPPPSSSGGSTPYAVGLENRTSSFLSSF